MKEKSTIVWEKEGKEWKRVKSAQEVVDEYENFARRGDVAYMFIFLVFVVGMGSLVSSALFAGVAFALVTKISPSVDRGYLGDEIKFILSWSFVFVTLVQIASIIVHARIGRLIASEIDET